MKKKILLSYLSYVNENNKDRRLHIFKETFKEFSKLKNDKHLSLLSIDNNSSEDIKSLLKDSHVFNYVIHLENNMYDLANLYLTAKTASELDYEYMMYCYDDFVFYDYNFAKDCIEFMDNYSEVQSMRMPWYEFKNSNYFNTNYTSKQENPDAVRHYNQMKLKKVGKAELTVDKNAVLLGDHQFRRADWHYTSRPTLWRTSFFFSLFESLGESLPVMQNFEGKAMKYFYEKGHLSSFIDGGVARTFKQSERMTSGGPSNFKSVYLSKKELDNAYNKHFVKA